MKKYSVLYAEDVPHYGVLDIEAPNNATAIEKARATSLNGITLDPDYENSVSKRIIHIEGPDGDLIATDVALDGTFLRYGGEAERKLCDAAPAMLEALKLCEEVLRYFARTDDGTPSISALHMARDAISAAEGVDA